MSSDRRPVGEIAPSGRLSNITPTLPASARPGAGQSGAAVGRGGDGAGREARLLRRGSLRPQRVPRAAEDSSELITAPA